MASVFGIEIVLAPWLEDEPRMQLTQQVAESLPPAFVREINDWMRDFFGVEARCIVTNGRAYMTPLAFERLRADLEGTNHE